MNEQTIMRRRLKALRARQLRLEVRNAQFKRDQLALFHAAKAAGVSWQEMADIMGLTLSGIANYVKRNDGIYPNSGHASKGDARPASTSQRAAVSMTTTDLAKGV